MTQKKQAQNPNPALEGLHPRLATQNPRSPFPKLILDDIHMLNHNPGFGPPLAILVPLRPAHFLGPPIPTPIATPIAAPIAALHFFPLTTLHPGRPTAFLGDFGFSCVGLWARLVLMLCL
jgi:hypothetical protein